MTEARHVETANPVEAWARLSEDPTAQLVDVRTRPEWTFVGVPLLQELGRQTVLAEWRQYPDMAIDNAFADRILDGFETALPRQILFICRSGARSAEAAMAVAGAAAARDLDIAMVNVAEGFEGDLDPNRHRGAMNGWKARGLPWQQS
ncbi:MAG: rhodanese-like domain-containing protein [Pseudomonadota bacterium]